MQERETKTITTPSGVDLVVKTYLTGREKREITNSFLNPNIKYNIEKSDVSGFNAGSMDAQQDVAFKLIVVSVDGKKDNDIVDGKPFSICDAILDMRDSDYEFVVFEINKITGGMDAQKKTA